MAKGRSAQAKAAAAQKLAAELASRPARQVLPTVGRNSVNGTNAQNLAIFGVCNRPLTPPELAEWDRVAFQLHSDLGTPMQLRDRPAVASHFLATFVKQLPAAVTFLPSDPEQDWDTAEAWLATTGAPNYTPPPGQPIKEINPERTGEGATPLLACLALLESRIKRQAWAFARKAQQGGLLVQHWATVEDYYRRNNLPFS